MITINSRRLCLALTLSLSAVMPASVWAGEAESWLNASNADKYCDTRRINDLKSANAFHNQAEVDQTTLSQGTLSQQKTKASNTGWGMQTIGSIEQRNCAAVVQADTQRYIVREQLKNQRYIYDTNIRQQLLGNMLRW